MDYILGIILVQSDSHIEDGDITPMAAENKTGRGHSYGFSIGRFPIRHFIEDGGHNTQSM